MFFFLVMSHFIVFSKSLKNDLDFISRAGEVQVLDFQTQQYRLFTQIASAYALMIAGRASAAAYTRVSAEIESGNLDDMPVVSCLCAAGQESFLTKLRMLEFDSGVVTRLHKKKIAW